MSSTTPSVQIYRERPQPRPIDPHWTCQKSGDCCSIPDEVTMTREERQALLPKIPIGIPTQWRDIDEKFVALKAHPCPFYVFKTCLVYEVRPFNCRRFGCMRPDPKAEPFEPEPVDLRTAPTGCKNANDRLWTSREMRRLAIRMQRKAQRWALRHGW